MKTLFKVEVSWYRCEYAKSRGMIHWHELQWRGDIEPHNLLYQAVLQHLKDQDMAAELASWAKQVFGLTAGYDDNGPNKHLWAPPEDTAPPP